MARNPINLMSKTARLKLAPRGGVYMERIAPGIFLGYRRLLERAGSWSWEASRKLHSLHALADDTEPANGISVMSGFQAREKALKEARGSEGSDKPITVGGALDAYAADLKTRGGAKSNAISIRKHLPQAMLDKTVILLTKEELESWRDGLAIDKGLEWDSANRYGKSLKAALALAARRDKRITDTRVWIEGLRLRKVKGASNPRNYYLPDATILAIVHECHVEGAEFGALIEVLAGTGTRESQALKLRPGDLRDEDPDAPLLMLWCSNKGKDRDPEQRPVSITPKLAQLVRTRAIARGPGRPLFDRIWNMSERFRVVLKRLGLDVSLTPYVLRHSSIIRSIRAGVPLRIIAIDHDTSVVEIEKTYGRFIPKTTDDVTRRALLADAAPATGNVVTLARANDSA